MKIYGITKKQNKVMPIFGLVVAALAFVKGFQNLTSGGWTFIICGLLLLILSLYKMTPVISEEGADDEISIAGIIKHNFWKWEDINYMFANFTKEAPNVLLIIRKGNATRKIKLSPDDIQQIFDWATERNDRMTIQYNGGREFKVKSRTTMSKEEYEAANEAAKDAAMAPSNFHEFAQEAKKVKAQKERELLLRKPDLKKVKVTRPESKLRKWR